MFGAGSFVVTYSILTAIVASFPPDQSTNLAAQRAGIAMIFLTSIFFSLSFGPVSWVLASEVFPTRTRSIGTSVATCANWAFNVLFSQVRTKGSFHPATFQNSNLTVRCLILQSRTFRGDTTSSSSCSTLWTS